MSRSYKKNLFATDNGNSKYGKRIANRRFRRQISLDNDMPARPRHKKYTQSWDICDYKFRGGSREEAIADYVIRTSKDPNGWFATKYPTLEKWLNYWEKCYRRK